jgi:hypothetical protein
MEKADHITLLLDSIAFQAGPGPSELVLAVSQDIQKTRQCKVRLCMRFTPVLAVCQAELGEVKETAKQILAPLFPAESPQKKFAVAYEHRASAKLDRMAVIKAVADDIPQVRRLCADADVILLGWACY